jgi:hypothetical protein
MASIETHPAGTERRIVCELDASSRAQLVLEDAIVRCKATGAELFVVWILEPRMFATPFPHGGAAGAWGLPHVLHAAVERAQAQGIRATSAVRIGRREVVLCTEASVEGTLELLEVAA